MEEASPAGQVQGLCCHSPTAKEGPEEGARGPIPPTLSEELSQAHTISKMLRSARTGWGPSAVPERGIGINLPRGGAKAAILGP